VNLFDFRPYFVKVSPDTVTTEADYTGDGGTTFAAVPAGALAKVVVFKESFSAAVHDLVIKRIVVLAHQRCKISKFKYQISGFQLSGVIQVSGVRFQVSGRKNIEAEH